MIVKYLWYTDRYSKSRGKRYIRSWEGLFLLGFIPLYIKNTNLSVR